MPDPVRCDFCPCTGTNAPPCGKPIFPWGLLMSKIEDRLDIVLVGLSSAAVEEPLLQHLIAGRCKAFLWQLQSTDLHGSISMSDTWYCQVRQQVVGPLSSSQLRDLASRGALAPMDLVRNGVNGIWTRAQQIQGLAFAKTIQSAPGGPPPLPTNSQPRRPPPLPGTQQPSPPRLPTNPPSVPSVTSATAPTGESDKSGHIAKIFHSRKALYFLAAGGGLFAIIAIIAVGLSFMNRGGRPPVEPGPPSQPIVANASEEKPPVRPSVRIEKPPVPKDTDQKATESSQVATASAAPVTLSRPSSPSDSPPLHERDAEVVVQLLENSRTGMQTDVDVPVLVVSAHRGTTEGRLLHLKLHLERVPDRHEPLQVAISKIRPAVPGT